MKKQMKNREQLHEHSMADVPHFAFSKKKKKGRNFGFVKHKNVTIYRNVYVIKRERIDAPTTSCLCSFVR